MSRRKKKGGIFRQLKSATRLFGGIGIAILAVGVIYAVIGLIARQSLPEYDFEPTEFSVIAVSKGNRNLNPQQRKNAEAKGESYNEIHYQWDVTYSYDFHGETYQWSDTVPYVSGKAAPKIGSTVQKMVAMSDEGPLLRSESGVYRMVGDGVFAMVIGGLFLIAAWVNQTAGKKRKTQVPKKKKQDAGAPEIIKK